MTNEQADDALVLAQLDRALSHISELEAENARLAARLAVSEAEVQRLMCWTVGAFVDGELDDERHAAFLLHLATCKTCSREVTNLQQMAARLSAMKERSDG
jgi:hypothetical protein